MVASPVLLHRHDPAPIGQGGAGVLGDDLLQHRRGELDHVEGLFPVPAQPWQHPPQVLPVDRAMQGIKRSTVVEAKGIPLGAVAAPANRHDSPLLEQTLDTLGVLGELPEQMSVHLDRGYDSRSTTEKLADRGLLAAISEKGKPAPLQATKRWVVERTNSWNNAHKKFP